MVIRRNIKLNSVVLDELNKQARRMGYKRTTEFLEAIALAEPKELFKLVGLRKIGW